MTPIEQFTVGVTKSDQVWANGQWVAANRQLMAAVTQLLTQRDKLAVTETKAGLRAERNGTVVAAVAVVTHRLMQNKTHLGSQQKTHIRGVAERLVQMSAPLHLLVVPDAHMRKATAAALSGAASVHLWSTSDLAHRAL